MSREEEMLVIATAEVFPTFLNEAKIATIKKEYLTKPQIEAVEALEGRRFTHKWQLHDGLAQQTADWKAREDLRLDKAHNQMLEERLDYLFRTFHADTDT